MSRRAGSRAIVLVAGLLAAAGAARAAEVALPERAGGLVFVDLDGDGRAEPVVLYGGEAGCLLATIAEPKGEARLEPLAIPGVGRAIAPLLADADGDGTVDLVCVSEGGLALRRGLGAGSFAPGSASIARAGDLLLPSRGCLSAPLILFDVQGDTAPELLAPVLGGVRAIAVPAAAPAPGAVSPPQEVELMVEPKLLSGDRSISFASALPSVLETPAGRILVLGPVIAGSASRLDFAWWSRRKEDGALAGHRSVFVLPPDEVAVLGHLFDAEGDGRPEFAVLTMPAHLKSFFGEYRLHLFRAGDRADAPTQPFYTAPTNLNYWQLPVITHRTTAGGTDLLLAFYRGLLKARLNVEVFAANGSGSFEPRPRDFEVGTSEEAERDFLQWADVDGDGIEDLAVSDDAGLQVYRGRPDRERPVENAPAWSAASIQPHGAGISLSISSDGRMGVSSGPGSGTVFRDLDGDGLAEVLWLSPSGKPALRIRVLTPAKAASGKK